MKAGAKMVAAALLMALGAPVHSQDAGCRTEAQIYVELETYGYRQIQFQGEKDGRLQATAVDHEGRINMLSLDTCSGEVVQVQKPSGP